MQVSPPTVYEYTLDSCAVVYGIQQAKGINLRQLSFRHFSASSISLARAVSKAGLHYTTPGSYSCVVYTPLCTSIQLVVVQLCAAPIRPMPHAPHQAFFRQLSTLSTLTHRRELGHSTLSDIFDLCFPTIPIPPFSTFQPHFPSSSDTFPSPATLFRPRATLFHLETTLSHPQRHFLVPPASLSRPHRRRSAQAGICRSGRCPYAVSIELCSGTSLPCLTPRSTQRTRHRWGCTRL